MTKKVTKNLILSLIMVISIILSSFLLVGCGKKKIPIEDIKIDLESTEVFCGQSKVLYYTLYPANANDYMLSWSTSDKSIVEINKYGELTAVDYGEATITLRVVGTEISSSCHVSVTEGQITGIRVNTGSSRHTYYEGEKIDPTGLLITGVYETGKTINLDINDCILEYPEFATQGACIKVTYGEYASRIFELNVIKDTILGLEITSQPTKTEYFIGEVFDPTGMEVVAKYFSGRKELITGYTYDTTPIDVNQLQVKISYNNLTKMVDIKSNARRIVTEPSQLQSAIDEGVSSIMITNGVLRSITTPIILNNAKNITIFSQRDTTTLRGLNTIPIKIIGTVENVRLIGFTLEAKGDSPAENIVDLSECSGGNITFKNMRFTTSQANTVLLPEGLDVTVSYNNCIFNYSA